MMGETHPVGWRQPIRLWNLWQGGVQLLQNFHIEAVFGTGTSPLTEKPPFHFVPLNFNSAGGDRAARTRQSAL